MLLNDDDLKLITNVNASFSHSLLIPDIRNIENREIKSVIGNTLYTALNTAYNADPESLSAVQKALLEYIQPAVANLVMWQYASKGTMIIDDKGFSVTSTETTKPASETKIENYKQACMNAGFNAIDDLIEFLEENIGDYPDWASSDAAKEARGLLIPSAKIFQQFVNIRASRRLYLIVSPVMRRIETENLSSTISSELYAEIKDQLESGTLSPTNEKLIYNLRSATAHLSWAKSLQEIALTINENGVMLMNNSFSGTVRALTPAESDRIAVIVNDHLQIGIGKLEIVKDYLQENADDYPLYKDSSCYIDLDSGETEDFENDPESGMLWM